MTPPAAPARYAVIGNPVAHSRSPRIHELFARATHERISYERILAPVGGFAEAVHAFRDAGGMGLSVTLPFKLDCLAFAEQAGTAARIAGAANTMAWRGDHWFADNTDGAGLENDLLHNLAAEVGGRDLLVLGAGGAARGILAPLLALGPRRLAIANRTPEGALELAALFRDRASLLTTLEAVAVPALAGQKFDIVINSTSASLSVQSESELPWPGGLFRQGGLAYDLMYGATPTTFLRWADSHGAARCADGLGMLVEQAALQFRLWRGVLPETGPVLAQLRAELQA